MNSSYMKYPFISSWIVSTSASDPRLILFFRKLDFPSRKIIFTKTWISLFISESNIFYLIIWTSKFCKKLIKFTKLLLALCDKSTSNLILNNKILDIKVTISICRLCDIALFIISCFMKILVNKKIILLQVTRQQRCSRFFSASLLTWEFLSIKRQADGAVGYKLSITLTSSSS